MLSPTASAPLAITPMDEEPSASSSSAPTPKVAFAEEEAIDRRSREAAAAERRRSRKTTFETHSENMAEQLAITLTQEGGSSTIDPELEAEVARQSARTAMFGKPVAEWTEEPGDNGRGW